MARGVSAAEKYAEVGEARPRCECHGEPMLWGADADLQAGGCWQCPEKRRESVRRWAKKNPERQREHVRRWCKENPEKTRESDRRYKAKKRLLANLASHPLLVEKNWPKECKLARLVVGGATSSERQAALAALEKSLKRKEKLWLMSLIMSAATRTMPAETRRLLSLESSAAA